MKNTHYTSTEIFPHTLDKKGNVIITIDNKRFKVCEEKMSVSNVVVKNTPTLFLKVRQILKSGKHSTKTKEMMVYKGEDGVFREMIFSL